MAFSGVGVTTVEYLGDLFLTKKRPNAFTKLAGGIQGGVKKTTAKEFPIGAFYSLPAPSQPARLEGAVAPNPNNTSITQTTNVIQIYQEAVSLTYLAMGEKSVSGVVPLPQGDMNGPVQNPRSQEFQVLRTLEKIGQDTNFSFLNGVFANPADPSTNALGTRGLLQAISTNLQDESVGAAITTGVAYRALVNALLESMIQYNGYEIDNTFALLAGATEFGNIAAAWSSLGTIFLQPESMEFGVKVRKIQTTFGTLMLVLDPDVPGALSTTLTVNEYAAGTTVTLASVTGLNPGDSINIDTGGTPETKIVASIAGLVVTLTTALVDNHASGATVTRGGSLCIANMGAIGVVGMEVPGKGMLFEEPLYKAGSSEQTQLYGQLGIDHAPEYLHGLLRVPYGCAVPQ